MLDEPLPDDAAARGAEGQANGHFLASCTGAGQHDVGHIDARDHQHAPDHREYHRDDESQVVMNPDLVCERKHAHAALAVRIRVGGSKRCRHPREFVARLMGRRTRAQPPKANDREVAAVCGRFGREDQRPPDLYAAEERELERVGQHPPDLAHLTVDSNASADHAGIRGEILAPHRMADNRDARSPWPFNARVEDPAQCRADAEHTEKV